MTGFSRDEAHFTYDFKRNTSTISSKFAINLICNDCSRFLYSFQVLLKLLNSKPCYTSAIIFNENTRGVKNCFVSCVAKLILSTVCCVPDMLYSVSC